MSWFGSRNKNKLNLRKKNVLSHHEKKYIQSALDSRLLTVSSCVFESVFGLMSSVFSCETDSSNFCMTNVDFATKTKQEKITYNCDKNNSNKYSKNNTNNNHKQTSVADPEIIKGGRRKTMDQPRRQMQIINYKRCIRGGDALLEKKF